MLISHLSVFLEFIKFSEFDILVGILVNASPVNNLDHLMNIHSPLEGNSPPVN